MDNYYSEEVCSVCNSHLIITETPTTPHYARLDCGKCRKFVRWLSNPNKFKTQRKKTGKKGVKQICNLHNFKEDVCFFCLRKRNQLGTYETLTVDHIQELDKDGQDEVENMQVLCSACHKLKNWCRLYMNWHLKNDTSTT